MKKVKVYYNLHRHCWSVVDYKTRRVIDHSTSLVLTNCVFKVSEAGRQRVIKTKQKNVHACVVGYISEAVIDDQQSVDVWYNPYKTSTFVAGTTPVMQAKAVIFNADRSVKAIF